MLAIRGGAGLGDSIYVQSVARYFSEKGHSVEVCSDWPDVFRPLAGVKVSPFRRDRIDHLAHYSRRRAAIGTDQFQDCCIEARIAEPVDFRLDWHPAKTDLVYRLRSVGRPIIAVQMPRAPFGRKDGFGSEFLPDCRRIQQAIDAIGVRAYFVQIGSGTKLHEFHGIDLDLANRTSVSDVIDVGYAADAFLGFCSFIVPLAESLNKPALLIWSRRGLKSPHEVVRQMTPKKILHSHSSRYVVDDCSEQELIAAADALCEQVRSPVAA